MYGLRGWRELIGAEVLNPAWALRPRQGLSASRSFNGRFGTARSNRAQRPLDMNAAWSRTDHPVLCSLVRRSRSGFREGSLLEVGMTTRWSRSSSTFGGRPAGHATAPTSPARFPGWCSGQQASAQSSSSASDASHDRAGRQAAGGHGGTEPTCERVVPAAAIRISSPHAYEPGAAPYPCVTLPAAGDSRMLMAWTCSDSPRPPGSSTWPDGCRGRGQLTNLLAAEHADRDGGRR